MPDKHLAADLQRMESMYGTFNPDPDDESIVASISQEALHAITSIAISTAALEAALKAVPLPQLRE